ncbi:hypothetical protein MTR67_036176 [Solanum verrucosum]|uniref:Uncharacterized protein n=1 Tax=Solanum verrucosum TaxID=315347 RepID=A0AAF0UC11_SOLVR|nr:hypothetical protein MTR67_036176 [Solanum verrucosum]
MPERTFEVIACWNKGETASLEKTDGKLSLQLVGGEYGSWKERNSRCFEDISSSLVSISFVFGVNLNTDDSKEIIYVLGTLYDEQGSSCCSLLALFFF